MANNSDNMILSDADMNLISSHFMDENFGVNGGNADNDTLVKSVRADKAARAESNRESERQAKHSQWDDWYGEEDDDSDKEFYDSEVKFEDLIDGDEDPNDNVDDLVGDSDDEGDEDEYNYDYENPQNFFRDLPNDIEIAPGLTKERILHLAKNEDELNEVSSFTKHIFDNMTQVNGFTKQLIQKNQTETQKTIDAIQRKLAHPATTATQKGQLYDDLEFQKRRMKEIEQDLVIEEKNIQHRKEMEYDNGFFQTDRVMRSQLGNNWKGNEVWNYLVRNAGIPVEAFREVVKTHGPQLAFLVMEAMENRQSKASRQAKAAAIMTRKSPKGVAAPKAKETSDANSRAAYLRRKEAKVGLTPSEHREKYNYLVD